MGSFYGNGATGSINNTSLSFDMVYHSRAAMEEGAQTDNIFLGRYILVDYEQPPVVLYFSESGNSVKAYRDKELTLVVPIKDCATNVLYINGLGSSPHLFYAISGGGFVPASDDAVSSYQANHAFDNKYGRSYDSTVWMKTYDSNVVYDSNRHEYRAPLDGEVPGAYRYVMIAELNSVTPEFHLMIEKPTEVPTTPYFDRDTTKLNYYLHLAPPFGSRVRTATAKGTVDGDDAESLLSDSKVTYDKVVHQPEVAPGYYTETVTVDGDIYYNKRGFNKVHHAMSPLVGGKKVADTINYELVESGRLYRDEQSDDLTATKTEKDTYQWFINLPSLGDSICEMWDFIYGYEPNEKYRFTKLANKRADITESQLDESTYACGITYDDTTVIGMLNTLRDLKGYKEVLQIGTPGAANNANIKKLYASESRTVNGVTVPLKYSCFIPDSKYEYTTEYDPKLAYYKKTGVDDNNEDTFEKINGSILVARDADGKYIIEREYDGSDKPAYGLYKKTDELKYMPVLLEEQIDDTLYGWFVRVHQLLGTGLPESRNTNTVIGALNTMNDIFEQFDLNLLPGRMLVTNPQTGRIEASNVYFPGPTTSSEYVLSQEGNWVCRLKQFKAGKNATVITPDTQSTVALTADETWLSITTSDSAINWKHLLVNDKDYTPTVENDRTFSLKDGGSFSIFSAAKIDTAGHLVGPKNTLIHLPKLTFSTAGAKTVNTVNEGKVFVGADVTTTTTDNISTTNIEWQWGYVSDQKLVNYILNQDDGALVATDTVNSAFSKLELRHNNLVKTVSDNKTAIEQTVSDLSNTVSQNKTAIEKTVGDLSSTVNDNKEAADQTHSDLQNAIDALTANEGETVGPIPALEQRVTALDSTDESALGAVHINANNITTLNTALYGEGGTAEAPIDTSIVGQLNAHGTALSNVTTLGANYVIAYDAAQTLLKLINAIDGSTIAEGTTCQWYQDNTPIENATSQTYSLAAKNDGVAYNYRCQYTIGNYTFGTAVLTITVPAPTV